MAEAGEEFVDETLGLPVEGAGLGVGGAVAGEGGQGVEGEGVRFPAVGGRAGEAAFFGTSGGGGGLRADALGEAFVEPERGALGVGFRGEPVGHLVGEAEGEFDAVGFGFEGDFVVALDCGGGREEESARVGGADGQGGGRGRGREGAQGRRHREGDHVNQPGIERAVRLGGQDHAGDAPAREDFGMDGLPGGGGAQRGGDQPEDGGEEDAQRWRKTDHAGQDSRFGWRRGREIRSFPGFPWMVLTARRT